VILDLRALLIEFDARLEANTMTSRPDEGERRRYAALMRELIALAEELRRGFGVVPSRRSIADISAQTLSIVPGWDHRRRLDHQQDRAPSAARSICAS
jgi:hypothetical protein